MAVVSTAHEATLNFGKDHPNQRVYEHAWNCCNCKMQAGPIHNQHCCECYHQHCKHCEGNWFTILASESRSKQWVKGRSYCPRRQSTPAKLQSPKSDNLEPDQTKSLDESQQNPASTENATGVITTEFSQATPAASCLPTAFSQTSPQSRNVLIEALSKSSPRILDCVDTEIGSIDEREPVQRATIFEDVLEIIESGIVSLLGDHLPLVARLLPRLFHSAVREDAKADNHTSDFAKGDKSTLGSKQTLNIKQTQQLGIASYGTSSESRSSSSSDNKRDQTVQASSATSKGHRRTRSFQKRGRGPDHPDKPDASPTSKKPRQMQPHSSINFACHFHKRYPTQYQKSREYAECVKARIPSDRLSRITDHYGSRHQFDAAQWDAMQDVIKDRGKHKVEKWFDIWDILFPGISRPASPYNEPEITSTRVPLPNADTFDRELARLLAAHEDFSLLGLHPNLARMFKEVGRQAYEQTIAMESESSQVLQVSNSVDGDGLKLRSQSLVGVDPRTTMAQLSARLSTPRQHGHQRELQNVSTSALPPPRLRTKSDTARRPVMKVQTDMSIPDTSRNAHSFMPYHDYFHPTGALSQETYTQEIYNEVPQLHHSSFPGDWAPVPQHTELAFQSSMDPYSTTTDTNPLNDSSFSDFLQSFTSPPIFNQQGSFAPNTIPIDDFPPFTPSPSGLCDVFGTFIPYLPVANDFSNFSSLPSSMPSFNYNNCSPLDPTLNTIPTFSNESPFNNPFFGHPSTPASASVPFTLREPRYRAPPLPHNENAMPSAEIVVATPQNTDHRYSVGMDAGSNLSHLLQGEMRPGMELEVMKKGKRNAGLHGGGFEGEM